MLLSQPLKLGSVTLPSRIGLAPLNSGFSGTSDNLAEIVAFYESFAAAGVAIVSVGGVAIAPGGRSNSGSLLTTDPRSLEALQAIAQAVHAHGSAVSVQIMHAGRQTSAVETGERIVAPSAQACPYYREVPAALTVEEIALIVEDFGKAGRMVAEAGADFVEIHAAHGYLLSGFLSRATNLRTDMYGGPLDNRFRMLSEVVCEVRQSVDIPIGVRANVREKAAAGLSVSELIGGLRPIVRQISYLSVTAGMYTLDDDWIIPRRSLGHALWGDEAYALRAALDIPVLLAGNIETADQAEDLLQRGMADIILLGRSLLADPHLYRKSVAGDLESVQPCTELYICKYHSRRATNLYCPHNPYLRVPGLLPKVALRPA